MTDSMPPKKAIALRYQNEEVPRIIAKGYGTIAEQIIAYAERHHVAVYPSVTIVDQLMKLDFDQQIPPELYGAIAEILAWIYQLEQQAEES